MASLAISSCRRSPVRAKTNEVRSRIWRAWSMCLTWLFSFSSVVRNRRSAFEIRVRERLPVRGKPRMSGSSHAAAEDRWHRKEAPCERHRQPVPAPTAPVKSLRKHAEADRAEQRPPEKFTASAVHGSPHDRMSAMRTTVLRATDCVIASITARARSPSRPPVSGSRWCRTQSPNSCICRL